MQNRSYFIVSCARSGSTSLAKILDTAENGICALEPNPNLTFESREMMEGRIHDPMAVLEATVLQRVREMLPKTEVYGEKNVTYGQFIPYLYDALSCKFIFIIRDGRDVVRSLVNWHEQKFGNIYRECKYPGNLSLAAITEAANLPIHLDFSDYARPRPQKGDPLFLKWSTLTRMEMCAYYWAFINDLYLKQLEKLPEDKWMIIDYTKPNTETIRKVFEFCGLSGFVESKVSELLDSRINSNTERGVPAGGFPDWKDWDSGMRKKFESIGGPMMYRLGYFRSNEEWKSDHFGACWKYPVNRVDWYQWMYDSRPKIHNEFVGWVKQMNMCGNIIASVADFGCGLGIGYCDDFSDIEYVGVDISGQNISWACQNRSNPRHRYICHDFIAGHLNEKVDLVFSIATIDNTYDIDKFIESMVVSARKWIYFTAYRGWFPHLNEHIYSYNIKHGCFYNDLSPSGILETLQGLGCTEITIKPTTPKNSKEHLETLVIACVPERK